MTTLHSLPVRASLLVGALTLLVLAGCSHKYSADDTAADGTGITSELIAPVPGDGVLDLRSRGSFYPHAVGNRWDYRVRVRNEITLTDSGAQPPQVEESALVIEITGTAQFGDHEYFLQREFDPDRPGFNEFPMRESRFGLFEFEPARAQSNVTVDEAPVDPTASDLAAYVDRTVTDPARRSAFQRAAAVVARKVAAIRDGVRPLRPRPGAEPGELTMLRYPLFVGARWIVREDPRFARIVVASERVNVPLGTFPAWKIRGTSELFGPQDRVHFWYSNLGLLRLRFHVIADVVDVGDHVIGQVVSDGDQSLTAIHLEGRTAAAGLVADPDTER